MAYNKENLQKEIRYAVEILRELSPYIRAEEVKFHSYSEVKDKDNPNITYHKYVFLEKPKKKEGESYIHTLLLSWHNKELVSYNKKKFSEENEDFQEEIEEAKEEE
ncbi:MAG: hypothetical protein N3G19_00930 [Candidatus Pacearchaeota archaeon]|nr:hypothetical protein [Candidatus Pacearchaeota archaeon]